MNIQFSYILMSNLKQMNGIDYIDSVNNDLFVGTIFIMFPWFHFFINGKASAIS
jgi:hypothetical protein